MQNMHDNLFVNYSVSPFRTFTKTSFHLDYLVMQLQFLDRLSEPVQKHVKQVERGSGLPINVYVESPLNSGGPNGQGQLEISISASRIKLYVPSNGYFPDGAVRHEVLHAERFCVQGIPQLTLSEYSFDQSYAGMLTAIDNVIEHLVIVPEEIKFHPERRVHWEAMSEMVWSDNLADSLEERQFDTSLNWTFLRHALPESPQIPIAMETMKKHDLWNFADKFANDLLSLIQSKEAMVRLLFRTFPFLPEGNSALAYMSGPGGNSQQPILSGNPS